MELGYIDYGGTRIYGILWNYDIYDIVELVYLGYAGTRIYRIC